MTHVFGGLAEPSSNEGEGKCLMFFEGYLNPRLTKGEGRVPQVFWWLAEPSSNEGEGEYLMFFEG